MIATFAQKVLFHEPFKGPKVVRVLAVDQRQRAQRQEIFFAVGDVFPFVLSFFFRSWAGAGISQGAMGE